MEEVSELEDEETIAAHLEKAHGLKTSFQAVHKFFKRASAGQIPLGLKDTGLTADVGKPLEPCTEPGVAVHHDPFSVEATPEELFAKTKRRYAGENKA